MNKYDGGPAFPVSILGETLIGKEGMTLRDYFAAKAMQGFAADPDALEGLDPDDLLGGMAYMAYRWADAMLEAREEE